MDSLLQQALNILEGWTKQTTCTIFSLSINEQNTSLYINWQTLLPEDNLTYLGVNFDKRLTWKQQTEKAGARAKVQLVLMKMPAGTTLGADTVTLRRQYNGRVRPVLEYVMTAQGTSPLWSGQLSTEPRNPLHHRGHELNADNGAWNNRRVPVTWWSQGLQTAKPGCQIQEAARPPYEADTVPANKGETEEGEFHLPEQNSWATTGHPWSELQRDPPMSCCSCLELGNFPHHSVYHPWCWSERLPKWPWEKVFYSGIPSNP